MASFVLLAHVLPVRVGSHGFWRELRMAVMMRINNAVGWWLSPSRMDDRWVRGPLKGRPDSNRALHPCTQNAGVDDAGGRGDAKRRETGPESRTPEDAERCGQLGLEPQTAGRKGNADSNWSTTDVG
ncbi:hypothetical protein C8R44DRAFT_848230 [Mycena epipterygia]|nr:hypothetical protein C8R44DRAFT_848230 [Mycena epipterygia]